MVYTATVPRIVPVPASEPPYDDGERPPQAPGHAPGQAPLPLVFERWPPRETQSKRLAAAEPVVPVPAAPAGLTIAALSAAGRRDSVGDDLADQRPWRRSSRAELCDPHLWAIRLSRGIAEVLSGARAARQLAAWLTPDALAVLIRCIHCRPTQGPAAAGTGRELRVLVRSVRTCEPSDGACEISVHLRIGPRSSALAMRAEGRNGRWICTELLLG